MKPTAAATLARLPLIALLALLISGCSTSRLPAAPGNALLVEQYNTAGTATKKTPLPLLTGTDAALVLTGTGAPQLIPLASFLPAATGTTLGGVIVGPGLAIAGGTISATGGGGGGGFPINGVGVAIVNPTSSQLRIASEYGSSLNLDTTNVANIILDAPSGEISMEANTSIRQHINEDGLDGYSSLGTSLLEVTVNAHTVDGDRQGSFFFAPVSANFSVAGNNPDSFAKLILDGAAEGFSLSGGRSNAVASIEGQTDGLLWLNGSAVWLYSANQSIVFNSNSGFEFNQASASATLNVINTPTTRLTVNSSGTIAYLSDITGGAGGLPGISTDPDDGADGPRIYADGQDIVLMTRQGSGDDYPNVTIRLSGHDIIFRYISVNGAEQVTLTEILAFMASVEQRLADAGL